MKGYCLPLLLLFLFRSPEPSPDYTACADTKLKAVRHYVFAYAVTHNHTPFYVKLGLTGVTFVVASGDDGSHASDPTCSSPVTVAGWPASSPYVLSVGATEFVGGGVPKVNPQSIDCGFPGVSGRIEGQSVCEMCLEASLHPLRP